MPRRMGAAHSPPCITARRGGCVINKSREATETDADGVVFLVVLNRKTTPASRSAEASRDFIDRSATPPCGDARRGMSWPETFRHFFHSSMTSLAVCLRQAKRYKFGRAFRRPDRDDDVLLALIHVAHWSASCAGRKLGFPKHRTRSLVVSTELHPATARRCADIERISFTHEKKCLCQQR